MATYNNEMNPPPFTSTPVGLAGARVAWSSIWTGFLVTVGVFLVLSTLGLAIGISAADVGPEAEGNMGGLSIGAAIWSGLTLLIALFVGGMVATRSGLVYDHAAGIVEGMLVWVLSIIAIIYLAGSGIGAVASGASGLLGGITRGASAAVSNVDLSNIGSGNVDDVLARLRDPKTVQVVAAATGTNQDEARSTLSGIAQRVEAARSDPDRAAAEARDGMQQLIDKAKARVDQAAARAQPYASATAWITFAAMIVSLGAAIAGALTGRAQAQRRLVVGRVSTS